MIGLWFVNIVCGVIVVKEDVVEVFKFGYFCGYGGDVWFFQFVFVDYVLWMVKNFFGGGNVMVFYMFGILFDVQKRYVFGIKFILESYLLGKFDYKFEDLIVYGGDYVIKVYGEWVKFVKKDVVGV